MTVTHSATLAIDEAVAARRAAGHAVVHLGFGEAGLPVQPELIDVLSGALGSNGYGPVAGTVDARAAAAGWFTRRATPTGPDQILFGPGSKPLIYAALAALDGDIVLPCPAWVSYAAQTALLGRRVVPVPIGAAGGIPDPLRLEQALSEARADGARPGVLVLTVPDNPTGTVADASSLAQVCAIADRHGLAVLSDEIYAPLIHEGTAPSAVNYLPDRTIVTTGLSKSLALGGWRIGYARTPDNEWGRTLRAAMVAIASEVWSCLATPMQHVAAHVLTDPPEVLAHIDASARLHARVATAMYEILVAAGVHCRAPQAGFYVYPDFAPLSLQLRGRGITTSSALARELLERQDVATLPGVVFGEPDENLTLRLATSLLYGADDVQRKAALSADAPDSLPWIADALDRVHAALYALT